MQVKKRQTYFVKEPDEAEESARARAQLSKKMLGLLEGATRTYLFALSRALKLASWNDGQVEIYIRQGADVVYFQSKNFATHE